MKAAQLFPTTPTSQDTMQAIVQSRYGTVPAEVLRLERITRPRPAAGEVLVQVRAAGLDRGTWHAMAGQPYLMRLGFGFRGPRNQVPATPSSSPRSSGPRSPASAAPPRPTWSAPSAPTTSSTTARPISPTAASATT